jgi:hypothetical protein
MENNLVALAVGQLCLTVYFLIFVAIKRIFHDNLINVNLLYFLISFYTIFGWIIITIPLDSMNPRNNVDSYIFKVYISNLYFALFMAVYELFNFSYYAINVEDIPISIITPTLIYIQISHIIAMAINVYYLYFPKKYEQAVQVEENV